MPRNLISVILPAIACGVVVAERAPEQREEATHVILGTVEGIYAREAKRTRHYLVDIAVTAVERGAGVKPGDRFYVRCYLWNRDYAKGKNLSEEEKKQLALEWSSYDGVPKEGERVRVFAKQRGAVYDGIYPAWYDVIKGK
jgi:hypothetical protein